MEKSKKKQEKKLIKRTANFYKSILRDAMDGFWIIDLKGNFLDVNDTYCKLIGYSQKELLKMNISDIEIKEKEEDVKRRIQEIKKKGKYNYSTQHRKKDGEIVDIEISANYADYLSGVIFIFIFARDVTARNKAEKEIATNLINSKKITEGRLVESYKHLGLINRKISLLLELGNVPKSKKQKQKIIDHILNLAMNISDAPTGYLYCSGGRGKFKLLSYKGAKKDQKEKAEVISFRTVGLLKRLIKERKLISGDIKRYEAKLLAMDNKLEYFVTLPLSKGTALGGFIFLGFNKKKSVDSQDMEFLDVFAMHASNALARAGVFK